jgi:signal peptidase II
MLFFPLVRFNWPEWVPVVGGDDFLFFSPVFNIADSSIFIGVVTILIFQRKFFIEKAAAPEARQDQTEERPTIGPLHENGVEKTQPETKGPSTL